MFQEGLSQPLRPRTRRRTPSTIPTCIKRLYSSIPNPGGNLNARVESYLRTKVTTDEAFTELSVRCLIPRSGAIRIRNCAEIRVGAYPQRIFGEGLLIDVLMGKQDPNEYRHPFGGLLFGGNKTLSVSCSGSRVTGSQNAPTLHDKIKM